MPACRGPQDSPSSRLSSSLSKDHGSDGMNFQRMCGTVQKGKQTKKMCLVSTSLFFVVVVLQFYFDSLLIEHILLHADQRLKKMFDKKKKYN